MQKLKGKLESSKQVHQFNLELQEELRALKENKRNSEKFSSSLNRLAARITPKRSEDEVSIFENRYSFAFPFMFSKNVSVQLCIFCVI